MTSTFHARVIAARVGSEGMITQLRGNLDGPYPMGEVHVYVAEDDLLSAQELLMADEVESAFDQPDDSAELPSSHALGLVLLGIIALAVVLFVRLF